MALCMVPSVAHSIRLVDTRIRSLKPNGQIYKVTNRDGLYVAATTGRAMSFRYNYRISGHQEALTIGAYGIGGIPLAEVAQHTLQNSCFLATLVITRGGRPPMQSCNTKLGRSQTSRQEPASKALSRP